MKTSPKHERSLLGPMFLVVAMTCCTTALGNSQLTSSQQKEANKKSNIELIRMQLRNEFQYASDIYFGENTDLAYTDSVPPSKSAKTVTEPEENTTSSKPSKAEETSSDTKTEEVASSPSSTSQSSTPAAQNPATPETPTDPTEPTEPNDPGPVITEPPPVVEPPVIDPPPPCPT